MENFKDKMYFCYSNKQKYFLNQKGIDSLFSARHAKTNKLFYVFYQSEELGQALTEFTEKKAEFFKNN